MSRRPIAEVLAAHTPELMSWPGVVGTAQGADAHGAPVIVVMIVRHDAALERRIPRTLEGWPVRIDVTGEIRALPDTGR